MDSTQEAHAERIKAAVRWLTASIGKTQAEIAVMCGYNNPTYFSQLLNGKKDIAASLDEKIASLHPNLNVDYLRGTSDNMFISDSWPSTPKMSQQQKPKQTGAGIFMPEELVQMFSDLSAAVRSQHETIVRLLDSSLK